MNITAVFKLYPQVVRTVGEDAFDADGNKVEIDPVLMAEYEQSITYIELRVEAYAKKPLTEQMDMQYWDAVNGTTVWIDWVAGIKAMYPK